VIRHARSAIIVAWTSLSAVAHADGPAPAPPATATTPLWIPTVSLGISSFDDRLRERIDGVDYDSYRGQYRTVLAVGLVHPVVRLSDDRIWIDGQVSGGVGVTFTTGDWELPIREDVTLAYAVRPWLTVRAGLGVGLMLDTSASDLSSAELAIPISVTLFHAIEIVYRPLLNIPLDHETSTVLGGESELSTRLTVLPFDLAVRIRITALGW
jgi:hypothetical protein